LDRTVRPEDRQGDVGTKLMQVAENWALEQDPELDYIDLVVQPANHEAIGFYEKHGYEAADVREDEEAVLQKFICPLLLCFFVQSLSYFTGCI